MGRKRVTPERREQIFEALERCILNRGLERTRITDVAEEAGIHAAAVRHFVGNRDDLIRGLVDHIADKYKEEGREPFAALSPAARIDALLDFLFVGGHLTKWADDDRVGEALHAAASHDEHVRARLCDMYLGIEAMLQRALRSSYPHASVEHIETVSYAIHCMSEHNNGLMFLGVSKERAAQARTAAETLIKTLLEEQS